MVFPSIETLEITCQHPEIVKGICVSCGECMETELVHGYTEYEKFTSVPHMKYRVKDKSKINLETIKKILIPCGLNSYLFQVRDQLMITEFKNRLKIEDKVILVLLNILKLNSFPIAIHDLLKYTNLNKHRLLRIYRDTFEYKEATTEYLQGIFERTEKALLQRGLELKKGDFEDFKSYFEILKNTDPKLLCLSYFYEVNNIYIKNLSKLDDYSSSQIRYTRTRIRNVKINENK